MKIIGCLIWALVLSFRLQAQEQPSGMKADPLGYPVHSFFIGTQIPLQYNVGYSYRFPHRFAARLQVGVLTKPYDRFIRSSMEAFGLDKELGRVIAKSFRGGTLLSLSANYHFPKSYTGLYGQYIHLQSGGVTPADALGIYFKRDFSGFDPQGLPAFAFAMQSNLYLLGALYGRQFPLPNPRWRIDGELSLAKVITSSSSFSSNRPGIDRTVLAKGLYQVLDREVGAAYQQHGWLPTLNVYLVYQLW
ncbi:hypothetical protein [Adhaeribacter pallidiroseus]|uniref:Uncharacterized protein n=1 Tax=Adhaeribacter pallidiroseus TaxID=2072847 RepID=A0A369Q232_9BACT|nr:hypothetical protein [Adhaeribacter pallidiroseus]RDC58824.1 hypothetical protein AHMF7616_05258 [Adhaeribacter pallidiroseus]